MSSEGGLRRFDRNFDCLQKSKSFGNCIVEKERGFKPSDRYDPAKKEILVNLSKQIWQKENPIPGLPTKKKINFEKIFTPAKDAKEILPKCRKHYASSAFYSPAIHPTVEDQVELARRISRSLSDISNQQSKGQSMYVNRKKRSVKWVHEGGEERAAIPEFDVTTTTSSSSYTEEVKENGFQNKSSSSSFSKSTTTSKEPLKFVMNPSGQMRDFESVKDEFNTDAGLSSPTVCSGLVSEINASEGKGAELFAKRRRKAENWSNSERLPNINVDPGLKFPGRDLAYRPAVPQGWKAPPPRLPKDEDSSNYSSIAFSATSFAASSTAVDNASVCDASFNCIQSQQENESNDNNNNSKCNNNNDYNNNDNGNDKQLEQYNFKDIAGNQEWKRKQEQQSERREIAENYKVQKSENQFNQSDEDEIVQYMQRTKIQSDSSSGYYQNLLKQEDIQQNFVNCIAKSPELLVSDARGNFLQYDSAIKELKTAIVTTKSKNSTDVNASQNTKIYTSTVETNAGNYQSFSKDEGLKGNPQQGEGIRKNDAKEKVEQTQMAMDTNRNKVDLRKFPLADNHSNKGEDEDNESDEEYVKIPVKALISSFEKQARPIMRYKPIEKTAKKVRRENPYEDDPDSEDGTENIKLEAGIQVNEEDLGCYINKNSTISSSSIIQQQQLARDDERRYETFSHYQQKSEQEQRYQNLQVQSEEDRAEGHRQKFVDAESDQEGLFRAPQISSDGYRRLPSPPTSAPPSFPFVKPSFPHQEHQDQYKSRFPIVSASSTSSSSSAFKKSSSDISSCQKTSTQMYQSKVKEEHFTESSSSESYKISSTGTATCFTPSALSQEKIAKFQQPDNDEDSQRAAVPLQKPSPRTVKISATPPAKSVVDSLGSSNKSCLKNQFQPIQPSAKFEDFNYELSSPSTLSTTTSPYSPFKLDYGKCPNYNTAPRGWNQMKNFYRPVTFNKKIVQSNLPFTDF